MKKLVLTLALVLLIAGNTFAGSLQDSLAGLIGIEPAPKLEALEPDTGGHFTAWGLMTPANMGDVKVGISGRVGFVQDDLEIGLQIDAQGFHGENHEQFSIYTLMHLEGDINTILGRPYVGGFFDILGREDSYGPAFGTIYNSIWVIEYRHDAAVQEDILFTGLCWTF